MTIFDDQHNQPAWRIQTISDPPGVPSFGYTVGLARYGLHDLHVSSRPSLGCDPGADYVLGHRAMARVLGDVAAAMAADALSLGDDVDVQLDAGLSTAYLEVGAPVPAGWVEALRASSDAVVPLPWALVRCPVGADPGVPPEEVGGWRRRVGDLVARTPRVHGFEDPDPSAFPARDDALGPLAPWVHAVAQALASAPAGAIVSSLVDDVVAQRDPELRTQLRERSRTVGRVQVLEPVERLTGRVVRAISQRRGYRTAVAVARRRPDLPYGCCVEQHLARLVHDAIESCLLVAALDDVVTASERTAIQAAWTPFVPFGVQVGAVV